MARWRHAGGFSLEAALRIEAEDRAGRERLLRYCARPAFALERLEQVREHELVYRLSRPQPDGTTQLRLTPLELIDRVQRSRGERSSMALSTRSGLSGREKRTVSEFAERP